ncbi:MAG: hypothetical protein IKZ45_04225 [Fibrobacter sp.]|nr:hypothetical protein [Fibrobacter sp.]
MRFPLFHLFLAFLALSLVACDSGSSAESSPYGDQRYERHVSGSGISADCYVYSKGNLYTVLMEQHFGNMGEVELVSQLELESPMKMREEVSLLGVLSPETPTEYCSQEKAAYEQGLGGTVTCSKTKITAEASIDDVNVGKLEVARKTVVAELSNSCDEFLEQFKSEVLDAE